MTMQRGIRKTRPVPGVLTFRWGARYDPETPSSRAILTGEVYLHVARDLALGVLETQLYGVLGGSFMPLLEEAALTHYAPEGRFDRAACRFRLSVLGPPRVLLRTSFYLGHTLVTTAVQRGVLLKTWAPLKGRVVRVRQPPPS